MKILGHIHSFNDEDVIDQAIQALLEQTYPVQEIVLVDNGSTDGTLARSFPKQVTVIRHTENLGTSGSVITGLQYGLTQGYEWIWLLDADSAPEKDALEKLVKLYKTVPRELQEQVWLLSGRHVERSEAGTEAASRIPYYEVIFTPGGAVRITLQPWQESCEFDATIWSGSLYKLEAVRKVGLPKTDYVLDWGEYEYGYQGRRCGYKGLMNKNSIIYHNIGGQPALHSRAYRLGPFSFALNELPPIRCYYVVRNVLYFWLYEYHDRNSHILWLYFRWIVKFTAPFWLRPYTHSREVMACLRGIKDGLWKNMHHRY